MSWFFILEKTATLSVNEILMNCSILETFMKIWKKSGRGVEKQNTLGYNISISLIIELLLIKRR